MSEVRHVLLDADGVLQELPGGWEAALEVLPHSADLVAELRSRGYGVHLATNQNPERAAYMRKRLGYDKLVDSSFYSCTVGHAKPDPAYFRKVLATLGAEPAEVGFVDDSAANVAAAREVGLVAHQWRAGDDIDTLRTLF